MTAMNIASAVLLALMLVLLFPRAKQMLANSRPAEPGDWRAFLLPLVAVVLFVLLLMKLV